MSFDPNFLPGITVRWKGERMTVVDCQDLSTVILQKPGRKRLYRAPLNAIEVDAGATGEAFNPPELSRVPKEAWDVALEQLTAIQPLLDMSPAERTFAHVRAIAEAQGKHPSTIYRWIDEYTRTKRVSVFLRKGRSDQGTYRLPEKVEKVLQDAIESEYLTEEKRDPGAVIEVVEAWCRNNNVKPPHPNTIRRRLSMYCERTKLEKRMGRQAAENKFEPMLGHFPGVDHPLAVVQIDHTPVDVIVVDEEDRQPINRPYLTIVIDIFSRMILGFSVYLEAPSAFTAGQAIAHAVLPKDDWIAEMRLKLDWPCWGKFRKLHADNAQEFRGTVIGRACQEHNITVEHRPKGQPRYGGHVERGFRTFMKRVHRLKGTTFSDIKERLDYDSSGRAIMTRAELERWLTLYIAKVYPNRFHRGIKDTPLARYKAGLLGKDGFRGIGIPAPIKDPTRFMLDFMPFEERTVQDYGILLNHVYYYDDALRRWICATDPDDPTKARKFTVRYNPRNMQSVFFLDPESGDYIEIPYRDRSRPPASYWEIAAATDRVREKGYANVNEDQIFEALAEMREIEQTAEKLTKRARRGREKRNHQPRMPAKLGSTAANPDNEPPPSEDVEDDDSPVSPYRGIVEPH